MDREGISVVVSLSLAFLVLSSHSGQVGAVGCSSVTDTRVMCASDGRIDVAMACSRNYIMKIYSAKYYISNTDQCPDFRVNDHSPHCLVDNIKSDIEKECSIKQSCVKRIPKRTSTNCGTNGIHYVRIIMTCEPLHYHNAEKAMVTAIDNVQSLGGYQLVYVNSHEKVLMEGKNDFADTTQGCVVTLPPNTQISFQMLYFVKSSASSSQCGQAIQIWDGVRYAESLCEVDVTHFLTAGCDASEENIYLRYVNNDPSVTVGFVFSVGVSHRVNGFTIKCGVPVSSMPAFYVPTQPRPITTPSIVTEREIPDGVTTVIPPGDGAPSKGLGESNVTLIIILVGVAVGLIVLVAIIGTVIRKLRRPKIEEEDLEDLSGKKNQAFVRDIYLDGETKSKLVMERPRNSTSTDSSFGIRI